MALFGILIAYAFVGCVYWLWMFVGTVRAVRSVPLLTGSDSPTPPNLAETLDRDSRLQ